MRNKYGFIVLLLFLCSTAAMSQGKKALFVIVDGIPADLIEKLNTPALDAIAREGGYARVMVGGEKNGYSQTPTISAVGYNTVLTGTWVNKHNVWDNDIVAPNYHYPTIFRVFKEQYPDKKVAIFSSWLDNRTKLVGDELPATGSVKIDHHFDGLENDTVNYPHDKEAAYMQRIDEAVVDHAADYIRKNGPDLSWVYLEYTDDMGHRYGDSPQYYKSIEGMDDRMRRLWEAVQYRQREMGEKWQIFITTDHGRDSATGRNHGRQSTRERLGWIVTNAKGLNTHFKGGKASIADIMPTIANFLDIKIPTDKLREIDGVPLVGPVSAEEPGAVRQGDQLIVTWKPLSSKGKAKIWLATSNNFKTGGEDAYTLMKTVPVKAGKASIDVSKMPSTFYKLIIETTGNVLNRWIIDKP